MLRRTRARGLPMLYALYEAAHDAAIPLRVAADAARDFWGSPLNPVGHADAARKIYA